MIPARQPAALALAIASKTRPYSVALVSPDHFRYREAEAVDADVVVRDPGVTLYCLDHERKRAIFTVTPSDVSLTAATFLYQAQHEAATSLIAVDYDALHELAGAAAFDPSRVLLLYSVGRCGSTLVSRLLDATPSVMSLSEPDVFTQIVALLETGACDPREAAALLRTCMRIVCAGQGDRAATHVAIKFRSQASNVAGVLHSELPGMRTAFLYRDAHAWARSTMRAFGPPPDQTPEQAAAAQDRIGRLLPLLNAQRRRLGRTLTPVEAMACHWTAVMNDALELLDHGVDLFCLRYEDLVAYPAEAIAALFRHAGLAVPEPETVAAVLAADSQAGTDLARDALDVRSNETRRDTSFDPGELDQAIAGLSPGLTASTVLPGTWRPPV